MNLDLIFEAFSNWISDTKVELGQSISRALDLRKMP